MLFGLNRSNRQRFPERRKAQIAQWRSNREKRRALNIERFNAQGKRPVAFGL